MQTRQVFIDVFISPNLQVKLKRIPTHTKELGVKIFLKDSGFMFL